MAQLAVNRLKLMFQGIVCPEFDCVVMGSYKFVRMLIVEFDVLAALIRVRGCRQQTLRLTRLHAPQNHQVAIGFAP